MGSKQPKSLVLACIVAMLSVACGKYACQAQAAPPCQPMNVVIDGAPADTLALAFQGHGYGQVITASDTVISSIRFEMPPELASFAQAILYVMDVDSSGRPNVLELPVYTSQIIPPPAYTGQDPQPLVFSFEPPMVLPRLARYFFDVNENGCLGVIKLLGNRMNIYPGGGAWMTALSDCDGSGPGPLTATVDPQLDLLCDITYCASEIVTSARTRTWGQLKILYR